MVHKSGTLTNLELALFNAVALVTLTTCVNNPAIMKQISEGQIFRIGTPSISRAGGYAKLSSYHYKLLNKLCGYGYLVANWETSRIKTYAVTKKGWQWVGIAVADPTEVPELPF